MNYNLVPCRIEDCDRAGRYKADTGGLHSIQLCATHALELMEMEREDGESTRQQHAG